MATAVHFVRPRTWTVPAATAICHCLPASYSAGGVECAVPSERSAIGRVESFVLSPPIWSGDESRSEILLFVKPSVVEVGMKQYRFFSFFPFNFLDDR